MEQNLHTQGPSLGTTALRDATRYMHKNNLYTYNEDGRS